MAANNEREKAASVLLKALEAGIVAGRQQPGGFFPCAIADNGALAVSGSVQNLTSEYYDRDAGKMCANIVADMVIDLSLPENN